MKKLLALVVAVAALASVSARAEPVTYILDPLHTAATWNISHFEFSRPWGKFAMISGKLVLDEANPEKSVVEASIPLSSLVTGVAKLDEHLKSKDFFNAEAFPEAKFISKKVTMEEGEKNVARVDGLFTLHGVTKPLTLYVTLNKIGTNIFKKQTVGFTAVATVNRSDFGITTYLPGLGDEVKLYIEAEANL